MPVILLTALDDKKDVVRGLELGASDFVSKPVEVSELAARVRNHVRTKRMLEQNRKEFAALKEIDEIKDKFLQITAHDLKSPLGTISMGIQILEDAVPQVVGVVPEYERIIQMMSYASNVMQTIVNDYLDLQALKTGRLELDVQTVPLNMHVTAVVDNLRHYAENKGITLQAELDPILPTCTGDPDRLAQVINNLVNNAIKFSPRGASVFVRTKGLDSKLRVEVKDSGPGIPPQEIPLLFEEFSRLSNRPTGGEKSSGVGLAISKSLIEAHHGQIGVETAVGQGSTFWVELPCQGKVQV
jgi:two-component system, sensor histidine kinase and response regulator